MYILHRTYSIIKRNIVLLKCSICGQEDCQNVYHEFKELSQLCHKNGTNASVVMTLRRLPQQLSSPSEATAEWQRTQQALLETTNCPPYLKCRFSHDLPSPPGVKF